MHSILPWCLLTLRNERPARGLEPLCIHARGSPQAGVWAVGM